MNVSSLHIPVESFFTLLCNNAAIGCWVMDIQNTHSWWSDSYYELLGIEDKNSTQSFEDFLEKTVHPDDRHLVVASIRNYLYFHAQSDKHEVRLKNTKTGLYNWYATFSEAKYDEAGTLQYIFGGILNIDEKKKGEEEVQKLKVIVEVAEEMMGIGTFESDFATGKRTWSKNVFDIFELPYDYDPSLMQREDFYDANDLRIALRALSELTHQKKPMDIEIRIKTAKGNTVWIRAMAKPVLDKNGTVR